MPETEVTERAEAILDEPFKVVPEAEKPETDPDSETEVEQEKKGKGGFSKKINKLTARNYQLEETNSQLQKRLEDIERRLEQPSAKPASSDKPTPDKFQTYEDYVEALADWKSEQKIGKALEDEKQRTAKEAQEAKIRSTFDVYNKRVSEARGKYEDFDEVVGQSDIAIPQAVQLAIVEMDNGPEVAYYLGQNPEEAEKLVEMSPLQAVMAIGRIAASLDSSNSSETKPVSRAAAPIKPVGASSTRSSVPLSEVSSQREWNQRRDAEERKRREG